MAEEDQIKWVTLEINFSDEEEARLEQVAERAGMPLKCLCIHAIFSFLSRDDTDEQREKWQRDLPVTLRHNGCEEAPRSGWFGTGSPEST